MFIARILFAFSLFSTFTVLHASRSPSELEHKDNTEALIVRAQRVLEPISPISVLNTELAQPVWAAIYFAYAEANQEIAESKGSAWMKRVPHALAWRWYNRIAGSRDCSRAKRAESIKFTGDNPFMWAARARIMECLLHGHGVQQDVPQARAMAEVLATKADDPFAKWVGKARLGQMLLLGQGSPLTRRTMEAGFNELYEAAEQDENRYARDLAKAYLHSAQNLYGFVPCGDIQHLVQSPFKEVSLLGTYLETLRAIPMCDSCDTLQSHIDQIRTFHRANTTNRLMRDASWMLQALFYNKIFSASIERVKTLPGEQPERLATWCVENSEAMENSVPLIIDTLTKQQRVQIARMVGISMKFDDLENHGQLLGLMQDVMRNEPISIRAFLGNDFVEFMLNNDNPDNMLFDPLLHPDVCYVLAQYADALRHEDCILMCRLGGFINLAFLYERFSHVADARNAYLQFSFDLLHELLAIGEFEELAGSMDQAAFAEYIIAAALEDGHPSAQAIRDARDVRGIITILRDHYASLMDVQAPALE